MPTLPDFRENASRAILIAGEISDELVHKLTVEICKLRGEAPDPVTVYINSPGGKIVCAEHIRSLLKTPDQDGNVCRVITVATCRADSAAAGLLALGDYAIAYPQAVIHCHGFRLSHREITTQRAEHLAASLKQSDDDFALRLARRTFGRMSFHFANLRSLFPEIRQGFLNSNPEAKPKSDFECFAFAISQRLSMDEFADLPKDAFWSQMRLLEMGDYVFKNKFAASDSDPPVKREAELLTRLLQYEMEERDDAQLQSWSLVDGGIDELVLDFKSFADYYWGPHTDDLEDHLEQFGALFLTPDEIKDYQALQDENEEAASKFLKDKAQPLVKPMWYFVVSLCRLLQRGEYSLSAVDAYWLGIVDEVIGEKLISFRLIAENPSA